MSESLSKPLFRENPSAWSIQFENVLTSHQISLSDKPSTTKALLGPEIEALYIYASQLFDNSQKKQSSLSSLDDKVSLSINIILFLFSDFVLVVEFRNI